MEVTHPSRFALQYEFCSPAIGNSFFLRSCESIDVCSVLRDEDEVAQVAHNEVRFVVRPDGIFERLYSRLRRKEFYIAGGKRKKKILSWWRCVIAHLHLLLKSGARRLQEH